MPLRRLECINITFGRCTVAIWWNYIKLCLRAFVLSFVRSFVRAFVRACARARLWLYNVVVKSNRSANIQEWKQKSLEIESESKDLLLLLNPYLSINK